MAHLSGAISGRCCTARGEGRCKGSCQTWVLLIHGGTCPLFSSQGRSVLPLQDCPECQNISQLDVGHTSLSCSRAHFYFYQPCMSDGLKHETHQPGSQVQPRRILMAALAGQSCGTSPIGDAETKKHGVVDSRPSLCGTLQHAARPSAAHQTMAVLVDGRPNDPRKGMVLQLHDTSSRVRDSPVQGQKYVGLTCGTMHGNQMQSRGETAAPKMKVCRAKPCAPRLTSPAARRGRSPPHPRLLKNALK